MSALADLLAGPGLVRPDVDEARAAAIAAEHFGLTGPARELGSQQDRNHLVGGHVLKVAQPAGRDDELAAQDAALRHLAGRLAGLAVPQPVPPRTGGPWAVVDGLRVRLLTWVPGAPVASWGHLAPVVVGRLGDAAGQVAAALADLEHPGLDRELQWDLRRAREVCALLAPHVRPDRREVLLRAVDAACDALDRLAPDLRVQPVHGDCTDDNVVARRGEDGRAEPTGVIDVGDVALGWLVGDLAATCASVLHHGRVRPPAVLPAVRAYDRRVPLTDAEVAAVWPGVVARAAVLVASGVHQGVVDPGNAYAVGAQEREWQVLATALTVPLEVGTALVQDALGRPARPVALPGGGRLLDGLDGAAVLDLSVTSPDLVEGAWLEPGAEQRAARAAGPVALTRWGEARLTRTEPGARDAPATVALGVDVHGVAGAVLAAPWAGRLEALPGGCRLVSAGPDLLLEGAQPRGTGPVAAGEPLGTVGPQGRLRVALSTLPPTGTVPEPVAYARPDEAPGWLAVCPDPSPLLGRDLRARAEPAAALLARRARSLAAVQEHYWADPPRVERGWREWLVTADGRTLLDAVNNVAAVGHSHPHVARAAARQLALLNTNSRFHYAAIADFTGRLAALLPPPLDAVLLVNSGSEAVDLALRLARTATGREDVVCVAEAYHGWTYASDAVSTSVADNPRALSTRPAWVHPLPAVNPYRGEHRGPGSGPAYAEQARRRVDELVAAGRPPAAFLCEAVSGSAGGVALPDGYLAEVYALVRAAGGLCVADEVQVGYGRMGSTFWGFEQQGVVPDVVAVAKAMGNGFPLGAVVTSRAVADAFAADGYFFSSSGGSPLSCAVGSAVLDVLEGERLQERARVVGAHLRRRFGELVGRVPLVGAVHGTGLYLGVELVRDLTALDPATAETAAVCERLLDLGVVVQPTGDRLNVLKVKPPMCFTVESADLLVDAVAEVLTSGW